MFMNRGMGEEDVEHIFNRTLLGHKKNDLMPLASLVAQLVKNLPAMQEIWVGKIPGEGQGYPLQYSGLENVTDCIVHGVAKSRTRLSDFFTSL